MRLKGKLAIRKWSLKLLSRTLYTKLEVQHRQAVREWLRAVIAKVPVYTGTAKGTFKPLGRYLRVAVPVSPINTSKKYFYYKGKKYRLGLTAAEEYLTFSFKSRRTPFTYSYNFDYDIKLPYLVWNDIQPGPSWFPFKTPPPYYATNAGEAAYNKYLSEIAPTRLPKIGTFSKVVKKRVS